MLCSVITGGARTPIGKLSGALKTARLAGRRRPSRTRRTAWMD